MNLIKTMTLNITRDMQAESESVRKAVEGLENFEKALREHAKNNSLEFFGKKKKVTDDFIEASANKMLKPSGKIGLQTIVIKDNYFKSYKKFPDFIQTHIFPGGMLPSISALNICSAASKTSFGSLPSVI